VGTIGRRKRFWLSIALYRLQRKTPIGLFMAEADGISQNSRDRRREINALPGDLARHHNECGGCEWWRPFERVLSQVVDYRLGVALVFLVTTHRSEHAGSVCGDAIG
jgi:hypothetical protein